MIIWENMFTLLFRYSTCTLYCDREKSANGIQYPPLVASSVGLFTCTAIYKRQKRYVTLNDWVVSLAGQNQNMLGKKEILCLMFEKLYYGATPNCKLDTCII